MYSPILRRLFLAEEIPTGDRAVFAFLEMVALAFAFEGVNALLNGLSWLICTGAFFGAIVFFFAGIKWPTIKQLLGRKVAATRLRFWLLSIVLVWVPIVCDYYDRHSNGSGYYVLPAKAWSKWNALGNQMQFIHDRKFNNEDVQLDGHAYINCTFDHVTFWYDGTGPTEMRGEMDIDSASSIQTRNPAIAQFEDILTHLGFLKGGMSFHPPATQPQ